MTDYREVAPPLVCDFLRHAINDENLTQKTVDEYFLDLRTFFRFMKLERGIVPPETPFDEIDIQDISLDFIKGISKIDIYAYVDYLRGIRIIHEGTAHETVGLSPASTKRKMASIKSFFYFLCVKMELVHVNPTLGITTPRIRKKLPEYLTEEESRRLLRAVAGPHKKRDYCIITLFLNCGLRVSEVVSINIDDYHHDGEDCILKVKGKGEKERQVFLNRSCVEALNDYLAIREEQYAPKPTAKKALFLSQMHNRMSVDAVQHLVKEKLKAAGLKEMSPHKLRHTAATLLLKGGVDIRTVQEVLGHESISTTQIYTHVDADDLRVASRANPLSRISPTPDAPSKANKK